MMVVSIAINKAVLPRFFSLKNDNNDNKINEIITSNLQLICGLFVLFMVSVGLVFPLFPGAYNTSIIVFVILTYNYVIFYGYNIYSNYLYYRGKTQKIFTNTLISAIVNMILNYFLISRYSSLGAAISTIISFVVLFILYYISVKRLEKKYYPMDNFIKYFLVTGVIAVMYSFVYNYLVVKLLITLIIDVVSFMYVIKGLKKRK